MSEEDNKDSITKLLLFKGGMEEFKMWNKKFLATSRRRGYRKILEGTEAVPDDNTVLDPDNDAENVLIQARKANERAYSDLLLSMGEEICFGIVDESVSDELPNGDAKKAWAALHKKYLPKTPANQVKLKMDFSNSRMKTDNSDPDEWINNLESIRKRLKDVKVNVTEQDIMLHVLAHLPQKYSVTAQIAEDKLNDTANPLTLTMLRDMLNTRYQRFSTEGNDDKKEEKALFSKFKGRCNNCGAWGHKGFQCPEKEKEESNGNGQNNSNNTNNNNKYKKFTGKCNHCGKIGHKMYQCWIKNPSLKPEKFKNPPSANYCQQTNGNGNSNDAVVLMALENDNKNKNNKIWIADTGASSHIVNSLDGMTDLKKKDGGIQVGNGDMAKVHYIGTYHGYITNNKEEKQKIVLTDVLVSFEIIENLFSLTKALKNGAGLINEGEVIGIKKNNTILKFDKRITSGNGYLMGCEIEPETVKKQLNETAAVAKNITKIDVNTFHKMLGHPSEAITRNTAKDLNYDLNGKMNDCDECSLGKIKQTKTNKERDVSKEKGETLFLDLSTIKYTSQGGKNHWILLVDDYSKYVWSMFVKKKSDLAETVKETLKTLINNHKLKIQKIRCDNAGENKMLKELIDNESWGVKMEYTAPGTPQQNGVVERAFATLYGRVRAMLNGAQLNDKLRHSLWAECANTATDLNNMMITDGENMSPHEKLFGNKPKFAHKLRTFGEVAVIKKSEFQQIKPKLDNRGIVGLFMGYSHNHAEGVYRFYCPDTKSIRLSRDVKWLNINYDAYKSAKEKGVVDQLEYVTIEDTVPNEVGENKGQAETETTNSEPTSEVKSGGRASGLDRMLKELHTSYNPTMETVAWALISKSIDTDETPQTFQQAWHHKNEEKRTAWRTAIRKEFHDMINRGVWRKVKKRDIPLGRKVIGSKWVFKEKKDGVFRARLVALGYNQVPGVDFTDNFSPVVSDATIKILIVIMLKKNWDSMMMDIETAFLEGKLTEKIYMTIPEGLELLEDIDVDEFLEVGGSMYGLVQAGRIWYKLASAVLVKEAKMQKCDLDPCLFYRKNELGEVIASVYVDDIFSIGDKGAVDDIISILKNNFSVKILGELKEYIGCKVVRINEKAWLKQPEIIEKIETSFGYLKDQEKELKAPLAAGTNLSRPTDEEILLNNEKQSTYRSGVGLLLYLVKLSRPDICNPVRELSKMMDRGTELHYKMLERVLLYVMQTKYLGLCFTPDFDEDWVLKGFSDSDYAGDKDSRISVSGYLIYLAGVLISWKSKGQKVPALSSTEAEYVAIAEAVKEILYIMQILKFLGITVKLPVKVHVDNMGAIFLANNSISGTRTKHIDIKMHFIRQYVEDGIVQIEFVRSDENKSDICTKNVKPELLIKHTDGMLEETTETKD